MGLFNIYILFLLPSILISINNIIIIIIILVLLIIEMIVEWGPFCQIFGYIIVDVCDKPFTLKFDFKHRNKRIYG